MAYERKSATDRRMQRFGKANQMSHESKGRSDRDALQKRLAEGRSAQKAAGAKRARIKGKEKGADAGTYGGARSFFFGS